MHNDLALQPLNTGKSRVLNLMTGRTQRNQPFKLLNGRTGTELENPLLVTVWSYSTTVPRRWTPADFTEHLRVLCYRDAQPVPSLLVDDGANVGAVSAWG
jgi:hypothetical protein